MDTLSYSFSACSDGNISYTITCTGPDCGLVSSVFGSSCASSGNTVTCGYNNCTGEVIYSSNSQIYETNTTFYAVNDLSINDCADVSFVVNGTSVSPLVTSSNPLCSASSAASATLGIASSITSSSSLSKPTTPSSILSNESATSSPCSSSTPSTGPNGPSHAVTATSLVVAPSLPAQTYVASLHTPITVQLSNSASGSAIVVPPSPPAQSHVASPQTPITAQPSNSASGSAIVTASALAGSKSVTVGSPSSSPFSSPSSSTLITVQTSSAARRIPRHHGIINSFLPILFLLLIAMTSTVMASGVSSNQQVNRPASFHKRSNAISQAHHNSRSGVLVSPGNLVGLFIDDASTWYTQFTNFLGDENPTLLDSFTTVEEDILNAVCQVFLNNVEGDFNRQILFKQDWQSCVALGETWVQKTQSALYGSNNTNPTGNGLLTTSLNFAASVGIQAGCDLLFSQLIRRYIGEDPVDQTCNDFLAALGLTPPKELAGGSGPPAGSGGGGSGSGSGSGSGNGVAATSTTPAAPPTPTPVQVDPTTTCSSYSSLGNTLFCQCTNQFSIGSSADYGNACLDGAGSLCYGFQVYRPQAATQQNAADYCDGSTKSCEWLSYSYSYTCCNCPDGYAGYYEGDCDQTGPYTCIGCPYDDYSLSKNVISGEWVCWPD